MLLLSKRRISIFRIDNVLTINNSALLALRGKNKPLIANKIQFQAPAKSRKLLYNDSLKAKQKIMNNVSKLHRIVSEQ